MSTLIKSLLGSTVALAIATTASWSNPSRWVHEWPDTDFSIHAVDLNEIMSGGPPKDGIPAIDNPSFVPVGSVDGFHDREPVMTVEIEGEVPRAYPVRYLIWHEIVNDVIGDVPVAVTFCPLCNSGLIFDRRIGSETYSFGVSGKLRHSDMVMYDRQTESWWQQFEGVAIVGVMTGTVLDQIPGWVESWFEFRTRNPDGLVMQEPGFPRPYGANPYVGYDTSYSPFLYSGDNPPHDIPPLARVVVVGDRAWPLIRVRDAGEITEGGVRISWKEGTASALDSGSIAGGREVGSVRVRDAATGADIPHDVAFAFAFHAFTPDGTWMID